MSERQTGTLTIDCFQQLEEKELIINGISDALMLLDAENCKILDVNQAFLNFYKLSKGRVLGRKCYEITHHLSSPCGVLGDDQCPLEETVETGNLSHTEYVHQTLEGENLYFEITAYPLKNSHGEVTRIIHLSRDVTDRKRAEQALKESADKIRKFAYSVAHDLKNPANSIYGLTKLLQRRYDSSFDEKGRIICNQVLRAAMEIDTLVGEINYFISAREAPLKVELIDLKEILQLLKEDFSNHPSIRQIKWIEPHFIPEIKADRLSTIRMLRNIIDNALKYGGEGLSEIKMGYDESDEFHILSVADDGVVIMTKDTKKIFDPFERISPSLGIEGTGLGLAIVKEIAEKHKGKVWTDSGHDKGTTFHVAISKELKLSDGK
jgi:PAS domain S-box-containing protein